MSSYMRTTVAVSTKAGKALASFLVISLLSSAVCSAALSSYQDAAQKCDQEIHKKLAKLSGEYANELNSLMDRFRSRGDLEKTLAVKKEKERFAGEGTLEERNLVEIPIQLRELQQKYLAAPKKAIERIAKSYVADLEEIKRRLTIDDKLDDAQAAQREVEKIQKKYGVINPARGSELRSEDLPKFVAMAKDLSIRTIVEGQEVGLTGLSNGQTYKLVKVDGPQVTIRVANSDVVVPVDATDLLQRIERKQKGLSEDAIQDDNEKSSEMQGGDSEMSATLRLLTPRGHCKLHQDGNALIIRSPYGEEDFAETTRSYRPPFILDAVAQTDSLNLRLHYGRGEIIFNWENRPDELRVHDPNVGAESPIAVAGRGSIPAGQWVRIRWAISTYKMTVSVNGKAVFNHDGDYARLQNPVGIGGHNGSTVRVRSFNIHN